MATRYLRITPSDTPNNGDGFWYQIDSVPDGNDLRLTDLYGGISISGGSATYIIGQMSPLPDNYQLLPVYYAASQYFQTNLNPAQATQYTGMFATGVEQMLDEFGEKSTNVAIDYGYSYRQTNPNLYPRNVGQ